MDEVNIELGKGLAGIDREIHHTQRQIARIYWAIEALLDLAEKEGSAAAAGRLTRCEEEKARLEATLHRLRATQERGKATVSKEVLVDAIERLRRNLREGSIRKRRQMRETFVQKIEVGKERGTLYYTFPLYTLALDDVVYLVVYLESTPGAIRTRAHGSGGRRSIH